MLARRATVVGSPWTLAAILVAALALRLPGLLSLPFWRDERYTLALASDPLLDQYSLVPVAGALDVVHLGNRDTVDGGTMAFDPAPDADDIGIQPNWLPNVDQSGPQTTVLGAPIGLDPTAAAARQSATAVTVARKKPLTSLYPGRRGWPALPREPWALSAQDWGRSGHQSSAADHAISGGLVPWRARYDDGRVRSVSLPTAWL